MKQKLLKSLRLRLCMLVAFVLCAGGNAWGTTYRLEQVTSVQGGKRYVFEQDGYVMKNSISSSALQCTNSYKTTGLTGTEIYVWELSSSSSNFQMSNVAQNSFLSNSSSTTLTWDSTNSVWAFNFQNDGTVIIQNTANNRFLGFTSASSHAYKAYAESNLGSYPHAIKVYQLVEEVSYNITAASNNTDYGTVSLSNSTITASPETGYQVSTSTPYTVSSGTASVSQNGNVFTVTPSSDCTVTINFEEIPKYSVTYDANGGTGTMTDSNSPYYDGTTVTVLGNTFTRDNYIFSKWNTAADGNGTNYDEDDTFTINANTTLYAQWIPTHTATFSVSGTTSTATVAEGAAITFPSNPDDINGMKFMGWYDNEYSHATDAPAYVTSATMGSSNITYYAVFARGTVVESDNVSDAVLEQTLQHSSWIPAGGTTSSKTEYTLFGNGAYVESSPFDLSKLMKIKVFGGTYGGADTYKYGTITDGANKWLDFELSGTGNAKEHSFTGGSALSGTKALRIGSICGNGSGSGLRISKVEIYVKGTHTEYINYCTTVDMRPIPEITMADVEMAWGDTDKSVAPSATVGGSEYTGSFTYESSSTNLTIASDGKLACNVPGTYTVTASIAATVNNQAAEKTCNVIVNKQNITITFANAEVEKTISDTSSDNKHNQTATVAPAAYDGTISYTVSGDGASIEGSEVTYTKSGTVTVTATASTTDLYNGNSTTYALKLSHANIAQIKVLTSDATECAFEANLTDAVVTYVKDNFAYIHDATADVMVNVANHGLKARDKINGKVTGTVKASNQIDVLIALDKSAATVTENCEIPDAEVKTLAEIKNAGTTYDGKLVTVNTATVTGSIASDANSGASIKDGSQIESTDVSFNIYAPNTGITVNANEKGNFTGFVSIFNGTSYRLNLYDQSQFNKTHNAPTAQTLTFASDEVVLDEDTEAYSDFVGQTVSGAQGTVTYALTGDAIGTVNENSGAVTLNGTYGTATITATAAAKDVTEAGVTTPYTTTDKTYTITVRPRYSTTFSVNGIETVVRQASYGAEITVPTPAATIGDYHFMGWKASSAIATPTDEAPTMVTPPTTPTSNVTYYAVYAREVIGDEEDVQSTMTFNSGTLQSGYLNNGVTWTFSGVTFLNSGNNAGMPNGAVVTFTLPSNSIKTKSVVAAKTQSWSTSNISIALTDDEDNQLNTFNDEFSYNFTNDNNQSSYYTLTATNQSSKTAWIRSLTVTYSVLGTTYVGYTTSLPEIEVTIPSSKFLSFCYGRALDFSNTDVKAYKAAVSDDKVTLTKVDVVPSNEGVILYCENPDTYTINVTDKTASDVTGNEMVGVLTRTQVLWNPSTGIYNYILQQGQFNMATDGYLKANRAYLHTTYDVSSSDVRTFTIVFDDDETGINAIKDEQVNGAIYNLAGQRLNKPQKGINIINGKKVLVK